MEGKVDVYRDRSDAVDCFAAGKRINRLRKILLGVRLQLAAVIWGTEKIRSVTSLGPRVRTVRRTIRGSPQTHLSPSFFSEADII